VEPSGSSSLVREGHAPSGTTCGGSHTLSPKGTNFFDRSTLFYGLHSAVSARILPHMLFYVRFYDQHPTAMYVIARGQDKETRCVWLMHVWEPGWLGGVVVRTPDL